MMGSSSVERLMGTVRHPSTGRRIGSITHGLAIIWNVFNYMTTDDRVEGPMREAESGQVAPHVCAQTAISGSDTTDGAAGLGSWSGAHV